MASDNVVEVRFGAPGNVREILVGTVEVDVPRSMGYFGGLAAAVGLGLIEPPLAVFIAAVPLFKALTNTVLPRPVRVIGEVLEGAAKPVGSDAEGVIQLEDQRRGDTTVIKAAPRSTTARAHGRRAQKPTPVDRYNAIASIGPHRAGRWPAAAAMRREGGKCGGFNVGPVG